MQILVDFNCYYEIVECDLCEQLIIREDSLPDYLFVKQNYRKTTTKNEWETITNIYLNSKHTQAGTLRHVFAFSLDDLFMFT